MHRDHQLLHSVAHPADVAIAASAAALQAATLDCFQTRGVCSQQTDLPVWGLALVLGLAPGPKLRQQQRDTQLVVSLIK